MLQKALTWQCGRLGQLHAVQVTTTQQNIFCLLGRVELTTGKPGLLGDDDEGDD